MCGIHYADETQPGRNSFPEFAFLAFSLDSCCVSLNFSFLRSVSLEGIAFINVYSPYVGAEMFDARTQYGLNMRIYNLCHGYVMRVSWIFGPNYPNISGRQLTHVQHCL